MTERMIYRDVVFDDLGFQAIGRKATRVAWTQIRRVALGHQVDEIALEAFYFWTFQTNDPDLLIEVQISTISTMQFDEEIRRRFDVSSVPAARDFIDTKFPIRTYIVYPTAERGQALYSVKRRRRCFWKGDVSFAKP